MVMVLMIRGGVCMVGIHMSVIIAVVILLVSHLSIDRDFPQEVKTGSYVVFGVLAVVYLIFGIF